METLTKFWLSALAVTLLLGACKKYEEGPITFKTPESRLTSTVWTLDDQPAEWAAMPGAVFTEEYTKDGKTKFHMLNPGNYDNTIQGNWEFDGKKEIITLNRTNTSSNTRKVLKLTSKQYWYLDSHGREYHLKR